MFSFLLFSNVRSVVVGIDFGHANIKAGMGKFSGVVAVNNQQSKKLSPSYFAFYNYSDPKNSHPLNGTHWAIDDIDNCTWDYTSLAENHAKRHPNNIIQSFFPLLNESIGLSHREAMAATLRYLLFTMDSGVYTPEKTMLTLSVEPFLSRHERYALKEVARLANTTLNFIVDSPTAVAHYYVLGRTKRLSNDIAFIDIGATGTWISIFSFSTMGKDVIMNQKAIVTNGTLGGNAMDKVVGDHLYQQFVKKFGKTTDSQKVMNRFYTAARMAKERLSIDIEYTVSMEDVIDDERFEYYITREEFNELIQPFADSLADLIKDAMEKAGISKLDTVEAIGGNSRPQLLHEVMANVTHVGQISHTLNPEEAVILGATILGSTKSSSYRLPKKIKSTTFCNTHIEVEVNGNKTDLYKPKDKAEKFMIRYYPLAKVNNTNFTIYADDDYARPLDIFSINFPENVTFPEDAEVMIKYGMDTFSLPAIEKIECDGKKLNVTHYFSDWQLNEERFNFSQSFIMKMEEIERDRHNASSTRNELEFYLFQIREKMESDDEFKEFLSEGDKVNITKGLQEAQEFLDNLNNPFAHSQVFRDQLNKFKDTTKDVEMRIEEWKLIPENLKSLNKTIREVAKYLKEEVPKKRPWLVTHYKDTYDNLVDNYNHTKEWLEENYYNLTHWNKTVNPETKHNQINVKRQILEFNMNGSKRQKKPTPTPKGWTPPPATPTPTPYEPPPPPPDWDRPPPPPDFDPGPRPEGYEGEWPPPPPPPPPRPEGWEGEWPPHHHHDVPPPPPPPPEHDVPPPPPPPEHDVPPPPEAEKVAENQQRTEERENLRDEVERKIGDDL
ncbi:dnaK protein [Trichomonas vaginalis G3]|uniref:DnaK protein n=1 Tax=Trichomonas vaginalis (strain ATCC PRA-98 / G3) TaxID=412133 RepID=A2DLZ5_TRIV3|nr:ATP binding [Trichomonas vaginalis G3]EAY18598.1 dnaK protein [Trichomonas vaginalis G3]KAI5491630.1 ATP binding [Trichomonas vaginalis G3]|eukprot:XP_001579584.1 dnaK protein [Trichomonas vaginalis G3]